MSYPVGRYDWRVVKGATWQPYLIIKDSAGDVIDISAYDARMTIRDVPGGTVIREFTVGDGLTITGASGRIDIDWAATATDDITQTEGVYDFEIIDGSSNVTRILQGKVHFLDEVTT